MADAGNDTTIRKNLALKTTFLCRTGPSVTIMLAPRPTRVSSGPDALVTGWMNNNAVSLHPVFQPNGYDIQRAERKKPNKTQVE